jgi:hypothetical protein
MHRAPATKISLLLAVLLLFASASKAQNARVLPLNHFAGVLRGIELTGGKPFIAQISCASQTHQN